jgi:hypothetical protein
MILGCLPGSHLVRRIDDYSMQKLNRTQFRHHVPTIDLCKVDQAPSIWIHVYDGLPFPDGRLHRGVQEGGFCGHTHLSPSREN